MWPYSLSAVFGELAMLSSAVPIETALSDPALTEEQRDKLDFVIRARDYAEQVIGLNVGNSYRNFVNVGDGVLAYNLSASRKDALDPYIWTLPITGPFPYLGFFDHDQAIAERDRLVELGYDTLVYEVDAFSTLGLLPDPVASTLLERSLGALADTIIHESLHNTIWRPGDTTFNESLANFVGRTASLDFLRFEFGDDTPLVDQTLHERQDSDRFQEFLETLTAELNTLYQSDLSSEEKITQRKDIFQSARQRFGSDFLPLMNNQLGYEVYTRFAFNNAFMLVNIRYHTNLELFEQIREMTGQNWADSLDLFRQAAQTDDPFGYLSALLPPAEPES